MLRDLGTQIGKPTLIGVAVLPSVFEDKTGINKDGTYANGYAALKETEHLMKLGAPDSAFFPENGITFHYDPSDESKRTVHDKPFEFLYVVDKPESFTVSDPVKAAADGLYLQFFSPLFGKQAGDYDNYTQHQRFLVPHDFEGKGIQGFSSFYGTYGAAVLHVPATGLIEYCAKTAALNLVKSNFLGNIPGDETFEYLRVNPDVYSEVLFRDGDLRPVKFEDFKDRKEEDQKILYDRLFMKRLRLLAACESDRELFDGKYFGFFRHGHLPGFVPVKADGSVKLDDGRIDPDNDDLSRMEWKASIGGMVLRALLPESDGADSGLVTKCKEIMFDQSQIPPPKLPEGRYEDFINAARRYERDMIQAGLQALEEGDASIPGFDMLQTLEFLKGKTDNISLVAKRYAVLAILEQVNEYLGKHAVDTPAPEYVKNKEQDTIKEKEAPQVIKTVCSKAKDRAAIAISNEFFLRLRDFKNTLNNYASTLRYLEQGFPRLEEEKARDCERLRTVGDESTNSYILDSEAFQMESGRRMWDFFYYDQVERMPELAADNPTVSCLLAESVAESAVGGGAGDSNQLERLYQGLYNHTSAVIQKMISGDPRSVDKARRAGLALPTALELEFDYRALYLSHVWDVDTGRDKEVRRFVNKFRAQQQVSQTIRKETVEDDVAKALKKDYLRDKVLRLVRERADLLCVYDESRDLQGGVRPDKVFLAVVSKDVCENKLMKEALVNADVPEENWVTDGWDNPREIIIYRARLNIPLYVLGRMDEMKNCYHTFRNLAKRPKALHIDRNWEDTLPDLDPDTSQENHRQSIIREQVVNFAALLTTAHPLANKTVSKGQKPLSCIFRRDGYYLLASPTRSPDRDPNGQDDENGTVRLGASMGEAIQKLPEVLESDVVGYFQYQQLLRSVREGLAPNVLIQVADLPKQWRENHDKLRNQYGSVPTDIQGKQLKDYADSYKRLREALEQLLEKLRNRQIELQTVGEDVSANTGTLSNDKARSNLHQCIDILTNFSAGWAAMENPDKSRTLPGAFDGIFEPLDEATLQGKLKQLRSGEVCYRGEEV